LGFADAGRPASPAPGRWALEDDFHAAYGYAELSAGAVARLSDALATDAEARRHYTKYYGVSAAPEFDGRTFPVYGAPSRTSRRRST
jgi:hypothetical protein